MRLLRAKEYRRMPWKNGGGETVEIAVFPLDAGIDGFDWRISMARVDRGGPFSLFAGIDRTLSVLDGDGLSLAVGEASAVPLAVDTAPFSFPADVATHAELLGGPVTDFNVMTRRGRFRHMVRRIDVTAETGFSSPASDTLLFCADGSVEIAADGRHAVLDGRDCVWFDAPIGVARLRARPSARILAVELWGTGPAAR